MWERLISIRDGVWGFLREMGQRWDSAALMRESWVVLEESATYILVGFAIAGVIHVFLRRTGATRFLGGMGTKSVAAATLVGAPLPLCSCGVLPAAVSLRRHGASKGATLSFLISTPETSVQSVALTYGLLGGPMAILRPVAACLTAFIAGITQNFFDKSDARGTADENGGSEHNHAHEHDADCDHDHGDHGHSHDAGLFGEEDDSTDASKRFSAGFAHAFVEVFDDVIGWMLVSFVVAAAIKVLLPPVVMATLAENTWFAMLLMLAIGIPMYVCAEASTPIAAMFIAQGVSPGAALVFLLAGPATNFATIAVLMKEMGRRSVIIYLTVISIVSVGMGMLLNYLTVRYGLVAETRVLQDTLIPSDIKRIGAIVFVVLTLLAMLRIGYPRRLLDGVNSCLPSFLRLPPKMALPLLVVVALGGYGASGFAAVQPDEIGIIRRFGAVANDNAGPGLHWVGPPPFCWIDRVTPGRIFRTELGAEALPEDSPSNRTSMFRGGNVVALSDRELRLADDNLVGVKLVIHWTVKPDAVREFRYGVSDADRLVSLAGQACVRQIISTTTIDRVLTGDRITLESALREEIQKRLSHASLGIEIAAIEFLDVHVPNPVHDAFRDIAVAMENRATSINNARRKRVTSLSGSESVAIRTEAEAVQSATGVLASARGQAWAFTRQLEEYQRAPLVTRMRMRFEQLETVLPRVRKYFRLDDGNGRPFDMWFGNKSAQSVEGF